MTDRTSRVIGFGMLTFLSVILAPSMFEAVASPSGLLAENIQILVNYAYPILIIWLIYKTIAAFL